ncbi:hypothetical protein K435DRAFT_875580, partial [Dendrothele bispora CBS 962.96]
MYACSSCSRKFSSTSSLSKHRKTNRTCSTVKPTLKSRRDKRSEELVVNNTVEASGSSTDALACQEGASTAANSSTYDTSTSSLDPHVADPPAAVAPPANTLRPSRTGRARFLPAHYVDHLPTLSHNMPRTLSSLENQTRTPLPPSPEKVSPPSPEQLKDPSPEPENIPEFVYFNTEPNEFGIYRSYPKLPKKLPDEEIPLDE